MATVDPDDDTIKRFIVQHYRHDPVRHERRNVVVAAFDDETEYEGYLHERSLELKARQAAGSADPEERISGVIHEAGHHKRSQDQRSAMRALQHGVSPSDMDRHRSPARGFGIVSAGGQEEGD